MRELISKVSRKLWVGGDPCYSLDLQKELKLVNSMDVIVDVRSHEERKLGPSWSNISNNEPVKIHVEMFDEKDQENDIEMFLDLYDELDRIADELETFKYKMRVFIHCHMGINRAPSAAMFLLVLLHEMDPFDAFNKIREARPQAFIAYAAEAVEAAYLIEDSDYPYDWAAFEQDYWESHQDDIKAINAAVKEKRKMLSEDKKAGKGWFDELGRLHVKA